MTSPCDKDGTTSSPCGHTYIVEVLSTVTMTTKAAQKRIMVNLSNLTCQVVCNHVAIKLIYANIKDMIVSIAVTRPWTAIDYDCGDRYHTQFCLKLVNTTQNLVKQCHDILNWDLEHKPQTLRTHWITGQRLAQCSNLTEMKECFKNKRIQNESSISNSNIQAWYHSSGQYGQEQRTEGTNGEENFASHFADRYG